MSSHGNKLPVNDLFCENSIYPHSIKVDSLFRRSGRVQQSPESEYQKPNNEPNWAKTDIQVSSVASIELIAQVPPLYKCN